MKSNKKTSKKKKTVNKKKKIKTRLQKIVRKKLSKKQEFIQSKVDKLLDKGKLRGFVTYSEILAEFPDI
ncbi:RNA polymerase sigma factor region1.1 domain-containing protein, partial [Patescibacteria group bacterium]|nr:RNA polymerase sigma factor region1.1 domain-containing protein [Patescibacteria group bacterium]